MRDRPTKHQRWTDSKDKASIYRFKQEYRWRFQIRLEAVVNTNVDFFE